MPHVPIGVYDHPDDGTVASVKSVHLPDGLPVGLARRLTNARDALYNLADSLNPLP